MLRRGASLFAGDLNEQTQLYIDYGVGYWLRRCPCATISELAVLAEMHYTTSLQDADAVGIVGLGEFGNRANRQDILNLTFGLHTKIEIRSRSQGRSR